MLWGIDLGGTKLEGVVLSSLEPLEVLCRVRIPTEADRGYRHILDRIIELTRLMQAESGAPVPEMIGFGTPGTVEPSTGLMKNCNTVCLNGSPLPSDLQSALGVEVRLANDANCFALAEATLGAGKGYATVFGVIIGTGVGGGLVVDGRVLQGTHGIAGEWGHNVVDPVGEPCYCGQQGCVETIISGPALEHFYAQAAGHSKRLEEIAADARDGRDSHAAATMDRLLEWFGRSLAQVVNIFDPHAIVLGGGVGKVDELHSLGRESLEKWVFNPHLETKLLRPALGDSAGVFGAALLCSAKP
jgi:fructokinase